MQTQVDQSSNQQVELYEKLKLEISDEFETQRSLFKSRWAMPVDQRIRTGRCISGLVLKGRDDSKTLIFECEVNESDMREGDTVRISDGDACNPILTEATIYEEGPGFIRICSNHFNSDIEKKLSNRDLVLDEDFFDLEKYYTEALDDLLRTENGRECILPLLLDGQINRNFDLEAVTDKMDDAASKGANEAQAEAIGFASEAPHVYIVHGPPGTGKTFVLAQIVKHRVAKGERVLITSSTHRAINNALSAYAKIKDPNTHVGRVGPVFFDAQLASANIETQENFSDLSFHDSGGSYVIGATPFATRTKRLRGVEFDTVIFDEASQITVPLAIMGMLAGRTYLFFGDDKQMPPVLTRIPQRQAVHYSIFKYLKDRSNDTFLNITYRMNDVITQWASESFYSGKLKPHETNAGRRLCFPQSSIVRDEILDTDHPLVVVPTGIQNYRKINYQESDIVLCLLREIVNRGISLSDVGVVVPFRKQARWIRYLLSKDSQFTAKDTKSCVVDTVERMQGQEREIIICSMTTASLDAVAELREFLYQPERLNVTVTRAKSKFIWIVSNAFFQTSTVNTDHKEDVELFISLKKAAFEVPIVTAKSGKII